MQWQVMLISAYRLGIQTGEKKNALFISSSIEQWLTMQFISQSPTRCVITKKVNKILIITAWESVISCRKDQRLSWVFSCSMVWVKRSVNVQQKLASCTWIAPRPSTVTSSITVNKQKKCCSKGGCNPFNPSFGSAPVARNGLLAFDLVFYRYTMCQVFFPVSKIFFKSKEPESFSCKV